MKLFFRLAAFPLLLLLAGCSEEPKTAAKKEPEKPPAPVGGRFALYQTYPMARGWSADIQPVKLVSIHLPEVKYEAGKAAAWQVTWISPSRNTTRNYTYSVVESAGNLHKGVFQGNEERGIRAGSSTFLLAALKTETDEVYATALKKSAEYVKKNPDKPVSFLLEMNKKFPNLSWRVIWGDSVGTSNYSIFVDATTGLYLETTR
jgi:hypothetical protein